MVSTADGVARFMAALLSGRLLPARLLDQMRTAVTPLPASMRGLVGSEDGYGLGLWRVDTPCDRACIAEGDMGYSSALAYAAPDGHRIAVILLNRDTQVPDIAFGEAVQAAITTAYCHTP
jgi:D-alanyl-D-alanine carboxypeptidase